MGTIHTLRLFSLEQVLDFGYITFKKNYSLTQIILTEISHYLFYKIIKH